jgi:hypothetical protein
MDVVLFGISQNPVPGSGVLSHGMPMSLLVEMTTKREFNCHSER